MKKILTLLTILLTITTYSQKNYEEFFRKEKHRFKISDTSKVNSKGTFTNVETYSTGNEYNNWGENNTQVVIYYNIYPYTYWNNYYHNYWYRPYYYNYPNYPYYYVHNYWHRPYYGHLHNPYNYGHNYNGYNYRNTPRTYSTPRTNRPRTYRPRTNRPRTYSTPRTSTPRTNRR